MSIPQPSWRTKKMSAATEQVFTLVWSWAHRLQLEGVSEEAIATGLKYDVRELRAAQAAGKLPQPHRREAFKAMIDNQFGAGTYDRGPDSLPAAPSPVALSTPQTAESQRPSRDYRRAEVRKLLENIRLLYEAREFRWHRNATYESNKDLLYNGVGLSPQRVDKQAIYREWMNLKQGGMVSTAGAGTFFFHWTLLEDLLHHPAKVEAIIEMVTSRVPKDHGAWNDSDDDIDEMGMDDDDRALGCANGG